MKKQQIKLIAAAAVLVILILLASLIYNKLGEKYRPDSLVTLPHESESREEIEVDSSSGEVDTEQGEDEASLAPDFTVIDAEGNSVKLSDKFGKPIVLNFWASWCPPCKAEMPDFDASYKEHGENVEFMMVNLTDGSRETVQSAKDFIASVGYSFPIYFDTTYAASMAYGASSIPVTFFINADGTVAAYGRGMLDAESLARGIEMINK